ncbi:MAG: aryl-sulfate sulfotransferase [Candidatus Gastranaerophilales bacterium]|nr:aryl-sulfate sulfotransferase [Candidatus Gastranaerophilales bacterium]
MKKSIFIISASILLILSTAIFFLLNHNHFLIINNTIEDIKINNYSIFLYKDKNQPSYEAMTLNTVSKTKIDIETKENEIIHKEIKLRKLKANKAIYIYSLKDKKAYKINLTPENLPKYKIKTKPGHTKGYLFTAPIEAINWSNAIAIIIKTNGDLIFYHNNPYKDMLLLANFKKHIMPDGTIYYSINMKKNDGKTIDYYECEIFLFDKNFNLIKKITFPDGSLTESHVFEMLDKDHYFLNDYYEEDIYIPEWKKTLKALHERVFEFKDGKAILKFDTKKNPELYKHPTIIYKSFWTHIKPGGHLNHILVDPKDNNLILSFGYSSCLVKIDRKTGKVIWILGGKNDMFNLKKEQSFILQHVPQFTSDGYLTFLNNNLNFETTGNKQFSLPGGSKITKIKIDDEKRQLKDFRSIELGMSIDIMGNIQELSANRYIIGQGHNQLRMFAEEKDIVTGKTYMVLDVPGYANYKVLLYETLD